MINIADILYVLDLTCKLFFISQTTRKEFEINFLDNDYYLYKEDDLVESALKVNNIYILNIS